MRSPASLLLVCFALSCAETTLPLRVEEPLSPTARETTVLSGSAAGAAEVVLTRTEPAEEDASHSAEVSPYSGEWRIEVPLAPGALNVFEIAAFGPSGESSEVHVINVEQVPVRAHHLELSVSPESVPVSAGAVRATVRAHHPEDVDLSGLPVELSIAGSATSPRELLTDGLGRAEVLLGGLREPGAFTVVAASGGEVAEADIEVYLEDPRAPAAISVVLASDEGEMDGEGRLSVPAGANVQVFLTVYDAQGHHVGDAPVEVFVGAPGAVYENQMLTGLERAGQYMVTAAVPGTPAVGEAPLRVRPGPPSSAELWLSHELVLVGEPLRYAVEARDSFGNDCPSVPTQVQALPSGEVLAHGPSHGTIVFDSTGEAIVTAAVDPEGAGPSDSAVVRVTEMGDAGISVAFITLVDGAVVGGAEPIEVRVEASASIAVEKVLLQIERSDGSVESRRWLAPPSRPVVETTFELEATEELDVIALTAMAVDERGAWAGDAIRVLAHPTLEATEGYDLRYVGGGPRGPLRGPVAVTGFDDGRVLVANFDSRDVVKLELGTREATTFAHSLPGGPRGIVRAPDGHVLVGHNDGGLARYDSSGLMLASHWAEVQPFAMRLGGDGLLYVVASVLNRVLVLSPGDVEAADMESAVVLECGEEGLAGPRGVALSEHVPGHRAIFVTTQNDDALQSCTDDGAGGDQGGEILASGALAVPRQVLALSPQDVLVASRDGGGVLRFSETQGAWSGEQVLGGLSQTIGIGETTDGRILVTGYDDDLLIELLLPE